MRYRFPFPPGLLAVLLMAGGTMSCSRDPEPSATAAAARAREQEPELQGWIDWYTRFATQAYFQAGKPNAAWDATVTNAFRFIALGRAGKADSPDWRATVVKMTTSALDQGCNDPFVRYLNVRFTYADPARPDPAVRPALTNAAVALRDSGYPMLLRFWGSVSAAAALKGTSRATTEEVAAWDSEAASFLSDALDADPPLPAPEADAASQVMFDLMWDHAQALPNYWDGLSPKLRRHYGKTAWFLRLEGAYHHHRAWHVRGEGWAKDVPKAVWKTYETELQLAEKAFRQAWSADPTSVSTANWMIDLCVSAGKERAEMEKWFQRAMRLAPGNLAACRQKLRYLSPRWHGSAHEVLAFARDCITNTHYQAPVPMAVTAAYRDLGGMLETEAQRSEFYGQPALWTDLQAAVAAMERQRPGETWFYQDVAWFAWRGGRWEEARAALAKVPRPDPGVFGGTEAYAKLLEELERRGGKPGPAAGRGAK